MVATSRAPTSARLRRIRLRARSSARRSRTAINALTTAPRLSVKTRATAMMTRARKGRYRRAASSRLAGEIVEQAEEREAAAEEQEGARQPIELRAGPDQMDHQHVRAGVGQEDPKSADRVGRGERAEGQHERREGRRGVRTPGRGQGPCHQWAVAQGELDEDEG